MRYLDLTGQDIKASDFFEVVFLRRPVRLSSQAIKKMNQSHRVVNKVLAEKHAVYGVNTGFGKLASKKISSNEILELQVNLLRSHACGFGPPLSEDETRGMLLLRAHGLAKGHSGIRGSVVDRLLQILNKPLYPVIPSRGSVGASGDLIPLAHLALLLIGEGEAIYNGEKLSGRTALKRAGIQPITLEAKEGLSLVNGTQASLTLGLLSLHAAGRLADAADLSGAMSLEALMGTPTPFEEKIQNLRPHPGQAQVAKNIRMLLKRSEVRASHITCNRIQDPYSIRCIPQVHGAVRDAIAYASKILLVEMNSITDNPIVYPDEEKILSGGNFHGHPIALALDLMAIALTHLGVISERRIAQLIDPDCIDLPPFLTRRPGLHSGLMMPQVAAAALVSECKLLSHPASVDSIPTSVNQEDYVSMAMGSALKLQQITTNIENVLAIELFASAEGISFHTPLMPGEGISKAMKKLRSKVPPLDGDRSLHPDFKKIGRMIHTGEFSLENFL